MKPRCVACGFSIMKSAEEDPFMCRTCEQEQNVERYAWLDRKVFTH
mgnify:CR=1 FL=1